MLDESICNLSSTIEGLIFRKTLKSSAISFSDAGGWVTTGRSLHIDRLKRLSTMLMTGAMLFAYTALNDLSS